MVFDSLKDRMGGHSNLTPMQIAHNTLFTAEEKIELLTQLKTEVLGAQETGSEVGFSAEEIDLAIAEVRRGVEDGVGSKTVLRGDF